MKYGVKNKYGEILYACDCAQYSMYKDANEYFDTDNLNIAYKYKEHYLPSSEVFEKEINK